MAYIDRDIALKLLERNSITKHITFSDGVSIYDTIANIPTADVAPKYEVDKAKQMGYELGKREVAREIYIALYNEIIAARNSNYEAIKERETKHNVNRYEDTFCYYCDGKIHALDGIFYFMDKLVKKYTEVPTDGNL